MLRLAIRPHLPVLLSLFALAVLRSHSAPLPSPDQAPSFNGAPFINPRIVQELSTWISDTGDQVVSINILDAQHSNRFYCQAKSTKANGNPYVYAETITVEAGQTNITSFGYSLVGKTSSGIYVLHTTDNGGGSGRFESILLLTFESDKGISYDLSKNGANTVKNRLLLKKVGEFALGDRWDSDLVVKENTLLIGKDKGIFAGTDKGGDLSSHSSTGVITIDLAR